MYVCSSSSGCCRACEEEEIILLRLLLLVGLGLRPGLGRTKAKAGRKAKAENDVFKYQIHSMFCSI